MSTEHLDQLVARLNSGDAAAAEDVFRTYEPCLRMVVRRELRPPVRAKFDSVDVVQSVWAEVVEGIRAGSWRFKDRAHLQAFLVRLTRNRFLDRCRKYGRAVASERSLSNLAAALQVESHWPRPSEFARRDELWERMLAVCPPEHHEVLRLKLEGLAPAEIAGRTGLHPGSIRRILADLARRVASAGAQDHARATSAP
jgi:RNA polymerase sigma-70 factor (ECF subfamily)